MIDPNREELVSLSRAGRIVNPTKGAHYSTVIRWTQRGVSGGIKLETVRVGGRVFTSREALARFIAKLNPTGAVAIPPGRAAQAAGESLAARGA